jgi:hypothetical protein
MKDKKKSDKLTQEEMAKGIVDKRDKEMLGLEYEELKIHMILYLE